MDMQQIATRKPDDCNPITMILLNKRNRGEPVIDGSLIDELSQDLRDEEHNYLIDDEEG